MKMSRQTVIEIGSDALREIGSDLICEVCIANGGSCCYGCRHLADGIGCTRRNTSCTAWLCGYLKYLLYATGQLKEWDEFWRQVPGQDFREDFTPAVFDVEKGLLIRSIRPLSEALAADLQELVRQHIAIGFILTLREKIDKNIDRLNQCEQDPKKRKKIERNIKVLASPFHRLRRALQQYEPNN
ncbi:DNA mismatch repair protein [Paenibacillus lycopersici]|uniref:DNA mismatch repair protein n=1 Tax=Paenibacillus lycopersici TaxID=2704462 RepID=A0A6C0G141_9BACL|nr:DNA mismatch repair protein [Paenibacillus lycopersici]QHT61104.1 DNA mismatch repair protein [Paenibacillus lycopersici]